MRRQSRAALLTAVMITAGFALAACGDIGPSSSYDREQAVASQIGVHRAGRLDYSFCFDDGLPGAAPTCEFEIAGHTARARVLLGLAQAGFHSVQASNSLFVEWVRDVNISGQKDEVEQTVFIRNLRPGQVFNREASAGLDYKTVTAPATIYGIQVTISAL